MGLDSILKKLIGGIVVTGSGAGLGYALGKSLYNSIVNLPNQYLSNATWFNYTQYIHLYNQYSYGYGHVFTSLFTLMFGGIALAGYIEYLLRK